MKVLSADTSTPYCSVALCECTQGESHVVVETTVRAGRRHSEILLPIVQDVLKLAGSALAEIDLFAISIGPGSFTGLRVGVASWKGLAFGMRKPLVGVATLTAMARRAGLVEGVVCPVLDARMQEVFAAAFECSKGIPEMIMEARVDAIERVLDDLPDGAVVFGDGALRYRAEIESRGRFVVPSAEFHYPSAASVGIEGWLRYSQGDPGDAAAVVPVYLRKSQAEQARAASEAPVA